MHFLTWSLHYPAPSFSFADVSLPEYFSSKKILEKVVAVRARLMGVKLASYFSESLREEEEEEEGGREDVGPGPGAGRAGARPGTIISSELSLWGRRCRDRRPRVSCPLHLWGGPVRTARPMSAQLGLAPTSHL